MENPGRMVIKQVELETVCGITSKIPKNLLKILCNLKLFADGTDIAYARLSGFLHHIA